VIKNNTISDNGGNGIQLYDEADGNIISDCTVSRNNREGIVLVGNCTGNRIADSVISGCNSNGVHFYAAFGDCNGNTLSDCVLEGNSGVGVLLDTNTGNCTKNRIEGNHISGTTGASSYGIRTVGSQDNLIVRNSCMGQTDNFSLDTDDTYGPEILASGTITNANPWANFSF